MRVVSVVGARPQLIKLKPMVDAFATRNIEHSIVHTGQHYDSKMSEVFFQSLQIPAPDANLEVGSGSPGKQTGRILTKIEPVLQNLNPDWVLVYGDTNSTIAATLAAVKLGLMTAHVEAGLRSWNRLMPEEINRILTDHAADLLLAPTELAMANLQREGLDMRSHLVGDVMADLVLNCRNHMNSEAIRHELGLAEDYVVATVHRASNTDDPEQLARLIAAISGLAWPVALVAHPRLVAAAQRWGITLAAGAITVVEPLDHSSMLSLLLGSRGLITDSGGLQKEAFLLGVPCTTLRTESEWPETLAGGMNVLAPQGDNLQDLVTRVVSPPASQPYGDGHASGRIVDLLISSN
jgi:UDP-N-acetylglucosamine 2-epimerase (non-hydrolysing)